MTLAGVVGDDAPVTVLRRPGAIAGQDDVEAVHRALAGLRERPDPVLVVGRCQPTSAFSRRDVLLPGHARAARTSLARGFAPVVRHVGGHLAAYDEGSLVLHLLCAHPEPRTDLRRRFVVLGRALARGLGEVGVPDARVGPVPGEYCDGEWSVNVAGRTKVVGTGQRLNRWGFVFSAVVTVTRVEPLREVLAACYRDLAIDLDPVTVGSVTDHAPGVGLVEVGEVLAAALARAARAHALVPHDER